MSQRTRKSVSAGLVAILVAVAFLSFRGLADSNSDAPDSGPSADPDPITVSLPSEVEVLLLRAGLDPSCLAAAGVSAQQLSVQLAGAEEDLGSALLALNTADGQYAEARGERDRLRRLVRSGQGTGEDVAALTIAKAALEAAEEARASALNSAFGAVTADLSDEQSATLAQIRANAKWKWCPVQYRVLDQTEESWFALRDALSGIHSHERIGDEAPAECLAHVADCDNHSAVSAAVSNCGSHTDALQATWDATFVE